MKRSRTVGICALLALALPATAQAHLRTGTVAVGYAATVSSPPARSGPFAVGIYASDLAVHLAVRPGHTVVVLGYLGEPFLRIGPAGVAVNAGSPTAAAVGLLAKAPGTGTGWRFEVGRSSAVWHDARVSRLRPGETSGAWRIPIRVDGRAAAIAGHTRKLPAPGLAPWAAVVAAFALLAAALAPVRTPARLATGCTALAALGGVAAVATAAGFALDSYASPGTWILSVDGTVFAVAAAAALVRGAGRWRIAGGAMLGLLALGGGLSKGPVFMRADVLSAIPGDWTRALVAVSIGAGGAAAALGGLWLVRAEREPGVGTAHVSPPQAT